MKDYSGKTAVVTGSASGIGFALAAELARRGANVVLSDIEAGPLDAAVDRLRADGGRVIGVVADVTSAQATAELADRAWAQFGSVEFVSLNAGVVYFGPAINMKASDWEWLLRVNLWGPINGVQAFLPRMLESGRESHISVTASAAALAMFRDSVGYGTSKAAALAFIEGIAVEHKDSNVSFSALCPMSVKTNIFHSNRNRPDELGGNTANSEEIAKRKNVSRVTTPADVAKLTLDSIARGQFYIHTHHEAQPFVDSRHADIVSAFGNTL